MIPQLRDWHGRYEAKGLTIVGVHSPEFFWEKPLAKLTSATRDLGIRYPVVQDNDFAIWRRYDNWAWPSAVLVDKKGIVRFTHVGEGAYAEMEQLIQRLLLEPR